MVAAVACAIMIVRGLSNDTPLTLSLPLSQTHVQHILDTQHNLCTCDAHRFPIPSVFSFAHRVSGAVLSIGTKSCAYCIAMV